LLTKFSNKSSIIFLDEHANVLPLSITNKQKINIILSPSHYWVKKISLPVKYAREAKKLLPSLFEDILPDGNYSYSVYKNDDDFLIFAYEDKAILDLIAKKNIPSSKIANIYFAQSELDNIKGAMKVNDTQSIYVKDGIVVLLPCCWIEESGNLDLTKIILSKHKINLQQFSHIVDTRSLYKIAKKLDFYPIQEA